jgi:hypothetical protein
MIEHALLYRALTDRGLVYIAFYIHLIACKIEIVHTDNRLITADCDSGKRLTRPLVREREPHINKPATV